MSPCLACCSDLRLVKFNKANHKMAPMFCDGLAFSSFLGFAHVGERSCQIHTRDHCQTGRIPPTTCSKVELYLLENRLQYSCAIFFSCRRCLEQAYRRLLEL
eukprot:gnl/MRDRNA2_/MRDRNA2_9412_c0_seq1.p2 gnl/MRDRNA2_/MRDRNA2_9412_c0~~gnl/MRDRNA2_/MRDRNA2_9412_c0_seq1.p2  ORF type:complete len:102 (+),score=12.12 gnl/MRDRNA2_/MRDRNA2_9412_c0_seq1:46-351(+)